MNRIYVTYVVNNLYGENMYFIGRFSFKGKGEKTWGDFTMIVSASSPPEALDKFKNEMEWIKKYGIDEEDNFF
jgi:hypothetical protein